MSRREKYDRIDPVDADLVWSAAQTAYRINGGYLKVPEKSGDKIVKPTNREIVRIAMYDTSMITDSDRARAQECRNYMASSATLAALKDRMTEWGQIVARLCEKKVINSNYDMAVITAIPQSHANDLKREEAEGRLARCSCVPATAGDKVELAGEVVRNNFSMKFNTWFVTVITKDNHAVWFAYREGAKLGTKITLRGTVKRHSDRATQLNRVKMEVLA